MVFMKLFLLNCLSLSILVLSFEHCALKSVNLRGFTVRASSISIVHSLPRTPIVRRFLFFFAKITNSFIQALAQLR